MTTINDKTDIVTRLAPEAPDSFSHCGRRNAETGFVCSRIRGHDGEHVSHGTERVTVWSAP